MKWTLSIIVLACLAGCGSDVAKLRARLSSIEGHARDIRSAVVEYRTEQPPDATEPPQIERIDKSAQSIAGEVKAAKKAAEGVMNKPTLMARIGNMVFAGLIGLMVVGFVLLYLVMRSRFVRAAVALSGVGVGVIPPGLPGAVNKAIRSQ